MKSMADDLVSTGLAALGYTYLAVDGKGLPDILLNLTAAC